MMMTMILAVITTIKPSNSENVRNVSSRLYSEVYAE